MADAQSLADRAYDQVVEWLQHFEDLDDPRQAGKVAYPLDEMLLQCLLAVLAGAESWVEIAAFGKRKLEFLRRFAPFSEGTPYPETELAPTLSCCGTDVDGEAEGTDALCEFFGFPGGVASGEVVGAEIVVEGAVLEHVIGGLQDRCCDGDGGLLRP